MNATTPSAPSADQLERCLRLRQTEFPWTADTTYFNNAGIGPIPERTRVVVDQLNAEKMAPHSIDVPGLFDRLAETRTTIASLINAKSDEIGLTTSTTLGLNVAAQALPVRAGEIVLLSDREFPANVYPWKQLESRGVVVELAPTTSDGWPDEEYMCDRVSDPKVRALAISLVQFSNGYRANIARLGEVCRANDCYLVVDGIQGIGQVAFDMKTMPVDLMACGGQKWLLSPFGSGFIYVRRGLLEQLEPTFVGWLAFEGTDDFSRLTEYHYSLRTDARRFEVNTLPFQDLIGMNESVKLLLEFGVDQIEDWLREVRQPLLEAADGGGLRVVSPLDAEHSSGIVCVAPSKLLERQQKLEEERVFVALREGTLRLSPHCYNTPDEMEKAVAILTESA
jgi:selenocysteine lyase/cysteine desulfurase